MYYFIVNPSAKSGRGKRIWNKLERFLIRETVEYQAYLTKRPLDARRFAKELTEGFKEPRTIVAVGGDGTVNEILDGISFGGLVTLGYIPAGSGNDLARSLRLPKKPVRCLKKILHAGNHQLTDYGVVTYGGEELSLRRFMVSAGIGMDAAVCHNLLYSRTKAFLNKLHIGKLTYLAVGIRQFFLAKPSKGYLLLDGTQKVEFGHAFFISAHIHPYEGGGFQFAPEASYTDGKLSICVMNNKKKRKLIPVFAAALAGRRSRNKGVRYYTCREASIHMDRPMAVHVDGESCFCQKDIQIRCIQNAVSMIV